MLLIKGFDILPCILKVLCRKCPLFLYHTKDSHKNQRREGLIHDNFTTKMSLEQGIKKRFYVNVIYGHVLQLNLQPISFLVYYKPLIFF